MNKKIAKLLLLAAGLFSALNLACTKTETVQTNVNTATVEPAGSVDPNVSTAANASALEEAPPDALVKDLYKTHDKNAGAIMSAKSRAILDKYFDKSLADFF